MRKNELLPELLPEMHTIKETSERSGLSYDTIRKMCLKNEIVFIKTGRKYLINWNRFIDYLNGELSREG